MLTQQNRLNLLRHVNQMIIAICDFLLIYCLFLVYLLLLFYFNTDFLLDVFLAKHLSIFSEVLLNL